MAAPAVLLFFSLFLVPDSPRWLVARGRNMDALKVLIKTSGKEFASYELFPNRLRSKGMSIAIVSLWIACTIVTITFPVMLEKLSGGITFLIFTLICLANLLYVLKYVPETKGKTLEDLEKEFGK